MFKETYEYIHPHTTTPTGLRSHTFDDQRGLYVYSVQHVECYGAIIPTLVAESFKFYPKTKRFGPFLVVDEMRHSVRRGASG